MAQSNYSKDEKLAILSLHHIAILTLKDEERYKTTLESRSLIMSGFFILVKNVSVLIFLFIRSLVLERRRSK